LSAATRRPFIPSLSKDVSLSLSLRAEGAAIPILKTDRHVASLLAMTKKRTLEKELRLLN